jgi:hypothetical protein
MPLQVLFSGLWVKVGCQLPASQFADHFPVRPGVSSADLRSLALRHRPKFAADFSCSSTYSRSFFTRFVIPVWVLQLVPTFLEVNQMTFLDEGCHTSRMKNDCPTKEQPRSHSWHPWKSWSWLVQSGCAPRGVVGWVGGWVFLIVEQ